MGDGSHSVIPPFSQTLEAGLPVCSAFYPCPKGVPSGGVGAPHSDSSREKQEMAPSLENQQPGQNEERGRRTEARKSNTDTEPSWAHSGYPKWLCMNSWGGTVGMW